METINEQINKMSKEDLGDFAFEMAIERYFEEKAEREWMFENQEINDYCDEK